MYIIGIQTEGGCLWSDWVGLRWFGTDGHCTTKASKARRFRYPETAAKYMVYLTKEHPHCTIELVKEQDVPPWC